MHKKKASTKPPMLMNWPPSRGPMPKWMSAKARYDIPNPKIERIEGSPPPIQIVPTVKIEPNLSAQEKRQVAAAKRRQKRTGLCFYFGKISRAKNDSRIECAWSMNYHVDTVASLTPEQAISLLQGNGSRPKNVYTPPGRAFVIDINGNHYLGDGVTARVTIEPYRRWEHRVGRWSGPQQSVGYLLWQIARVFRQIWRQHKKYNPWGHSVTDLYFEGLSFKHNVLRIDIGS